MPSFTEFVIDGQYYTSPNQRTPPPIPSSSDSTWLPESSSPTELRSRVWAANNSPYLPLILNSPFHGVMNSHFGIPPDEIPLEKNIHGYHLPRDTAKSWKTFEQYCRQTAKVLRSSFDKDHPKKPLNCLIPTNPSLFGYFTAHSSKKRARSALSESLDAFVVLFAYVSFCIALCKSRKDPASVSLTSPSPKPRWFDTLSAPESKLPPEWLQLLAGSPLADFTPAQQRLGAIVNVAQCSWLHLVPRMLRANVPIWLYWGVPPAFGRPLDPGALRFAPRSHLQSSASMPETNPVQSAVSGIPFAHAGAGQRPGETWREFMIRQNHRWQLRLQNETDVQRQIRECRQTTTATLNCSGKDGPSVFIWKEVQDGVWTRTLLTHEEVEVYWGRYSPSQKIFNSMDNCWDLCFEFDEGDPESGSYSDEDLSSDRPTISQPEVVIMCVDNDDS